MESGSPNVVARWMCAALPGAGSGPSDGQLLEWMGTRDREAAFEQLVRRYGPLVLGVCRRVLGDAHDADDAFQATFLVLLRKSGSLARPERLGNWLCGVAYRTALEARALRARRRTRESPVASPPETAAPAAEPGDDLRAALDREVSRLPEKYRAPVLLCELQGRSRRDAARQLAIPEGTLSSRLAEARRRLARRLARHAGAAGAVALGLALGDQRAGAVPVELLRPLVRSAGGITGPAGAGAVPARVAALANGVQRAMFLQKLKLTTLGLLGTGLLGAAAALLALPGSLPAGPAEAIASAQEAARDGKAKDEKKDKEEAPKELKEALEKLQGTWDVEFFYLKGDKVILPKTKWTIKDDKVVFNWVLLGGDDVGGPEQEAKIKLLAPDKNAKPGDPRPADLIVTVGKKKELCPAIYETDGKRLKVCMRMGGVGRPKEFQPDADGDVVVFTFTKAN